MSRGVQMDPPSAYKGGGVVPPYATRPIEGPVESTMRHELREGLTLTRCDVCGCRQWCAVSGTAMCEKCCPGAVEIAREEAKERRIERETKRLWVDEPLPHTADDPMGDPIPYREVAHVF